MENLRTNELRLGNLIIEITLFRGLGFGYFRQNIKTIVQEDNLVFDLKVVNYIFIFLSIGVYSKTNFRTII